MKRPKHTMRRYSWALAIVSFLVILLAAPLLFTDRYSRIVLQSGAVFAASNNTYSLTSPVRLMSGPNVELAEGTLSVPPTRTGLARGGQVIAMLITGNGPQMTLDKAVFTTDFSAREPTFQGNATEPVAPLVQALQGMQFDGLILRDSTVRIKMSDGGIVELDNVNASISSKPNGAVIASGTFDFHGEKVAFDTTLGASLDAQGMTRPLTASFTGKLLTANLDGSLMLGENPQLLAPQASLAAPELRETARWLGVDWPAGDGFGAFNAKGQLEWVGRTVAFQNAALELDDNDASGTFSINFAGPRPNAEGTLSLKMLDLRQYLKGSDAKAQQASLLSRVRGASGFEFPLIQAVDADFRISADSVTLPAITIGRSAATVSLRNGKMLADIAELEFEDGTRGGGQLRIDMSGANPSYGVQAKYEAPDVGRSLQAMFGHPTVQGRGAITIDLMAAGNTGESLLGSLAGKLCVTLAEDGRIGLDVNKLAGAASDAQPDAAWLAVSTSAISVDKLDAKFTVADGVIRTQAVEAISGARAVKAEGAIALLEKRLNVKLTVGDVEQAPGKTDVPPAMRLLARETISVEGPWTAPAISSSPATGDAQPLTLPNAG